MYAIRSYYVLLGQEGVIIIETLGIQQAQAGKVTLMAQLIRGGGQQQHTGDLLGQGFDDLIGAAGGRLTPLQMVRLVHHQQIPLGLMDLIEAGPLLAQPVQAADHQLFAVEGIVGFVCGLDAALLIKQGKMQVEAPTHLDEPLVLQGLGHQDQHPLGATAQQLLVNDHAGLDGLTQPHFVGQQYPRRMALAHFPGDVQLMGRITSYNVCYTKLLRQLQAAFSDGQPTVEQRQRLLEVAELLGFSSSVVMSALVMPRPRHSSQIPATSGCMKTL